MRRQKTAALVVAAAVVLAAVGVAGADHFSDVAPGDPFYEEIEWMADNNISTGYPDGTYRPNLPVSRRAMSAFMERLARNLLPRVATRSNTNLPDQNTNLATAIRAPARGYLVMTGNVDLNRGGAASTDVVICSLQVNGTNVPSSSFYTTATSGEDYESICTTTGTIPVPAGTHSVRLNITSVSSGTNLFDGHLNVLWMPHGAGGVPPSSAAINDAQIATTEGDEKE